MNNEYQLRKHYEDGSYVGLTKNTDLNVVSESFDNYVDLFPCGKFSIVRDDGKICIEYDGGFYE